MKRKLPLGTLLVRSVLNYLLWAAFNPENSNQDVFFLLMRFFFPNSHPSLNIIKCTNKYNQMAARVKETLSTQAVQSWVYQKWFGSGHGGLIPSLWWASCVWTQQQTFQIKRWGKRRASACARWPEDILDSSELSYQSLWEGSATSVMQRTSWCDSQSFLWSCMCKMLLWLSVITLLTPQYCICYQIWHENTTMCNMKQWALKWGRQKYHYMYILTSYGSSFKCSFFLLNDILNGPSPKQLQTKKKTCSTLWHPKKKNQNPEASSRGRPRGLIRVLGPSCSSLGLH